MSYTVVRGNPTAAQLYLDNLIDEVLHQRGIKPWIENRENVSLTQLLFHCLKRQPDAVFMINGATGEKITNEQILQRAVPLARAFVAMNARGKIVIQLMRNHQHMMAVYLAGLFAGVIPFGVDSTTTAYELTRFIELSEPLYVVYDKEHEKLLQEALKNTRLTPILLIGDDPEHLMKFVSNDYDITYQVPNALPDDTLVLIPTSGSTGLPKAAALTHRGSVTQMPSYWSSFTKFPTPTDLAMIITSNQQGTFYMSMITCITYQVPMLISPKKITVENITDMLEKYRPTWTFFPPSLASALVQTITSEQFSSLKTVIILGSPPSSELMKALKEKLPSTADLWDGYGSAEVHGFIALPDKDTPINSNGRVVNCLEYKIVDENGKQLGPGGSGELWLRGNCIIKKYHNSKELDRHLTPDGWYKTGDEFYLDENKRIYFSIRKRFIFKSNGRQVSPEEIERVISTVAGVSECVVCETEKGPAAAVVMQFDANVAKEDIHKVVNVTMSDHKRLRGGIVFVPSLTHNHAGKLNRAECSKLISEAIAKGDCC